MEEGDSKGGDVERITFTERAKRRGIIVEAVSNPTTKNQLKKPKKRASMLETYMANRTLNTNTPSRAPPPPPPPPPKSSSSSSSTSPLPSSTQLPFRRRTFRNSLTGQDDQPTTNLSLGG